MTKTLVRMIAKPRSALAQIRIWTVNVPQMNRVDLGKSIRGRCDPATPLKT